ncbi:MAG: GH18 family chitinase [Saprospiraceae bacterium]|jgi:GH18 family chitinase
MKKTALTLFAILMLLNVSVKSQAACKEIIGYYASWLMYQRGGAVVPESIDYSKYSIINFSFFAPDENGFIEGTDPWADTLLLRGRVDWGKPQPAYYPNTSLVDFAHLWGVKVMVSIGGWTLSDNFPGIAADSVKTARFASECVRVIKAYQFDGIDIDWEYPCYEEHAGRQDTDRDGFTFLMRSIRDSIDAYGKKTETDFLLTAAFGAQDIRMQCIDYKEVTKFMDYVNMMTYDMNGVWNEEANHNSPLFDPEYGPAQSLNETHRLLTEKYGIHPSKINMGVAFYGRTLRGFKEEPKLFGKHKGKADDVRFALHEGSPTYFQIMLEKHNYKEYWDDVAKVPYLIDEKDSSFVSYDNPKSIRLKAQFIMDKKCAGAIIWDLTNDYMEKKPGTLLISGTPLVDQLVDVLQPCSRPRIKKIY